MGLCELCGVDDKLVDALVEGSVLQVCGRCKAFGDVINVHRDEIIQTKQKNVYFKEPEEYIVDDYGLRIKEAREKLNMKQEELAKKINEKESTIHKLESNQLKPSLALANKLEKFLGIKIVEKYDDSDKPKIDLKDSSLTIGDLLKLKR